MTLEVCVVPLLVMIALMLAMISFQIAVRNDGKDQQS